MSYRNYITYFLRQKEIFINKTITTSKTWTCRFEESAYLFGEMYYQHGYTEILKVFKVKSPILSKKGKMWQEEYQMKLLKLARNETKQRM